MWGGEGGGSRAVLSLTKFEMAVSYSDGKAK